MISINKRPFKLTFLSTFIFLFAMSCNDVINNKETGDINISFNFPNKDSNQTLSVTSPVTLKNIKKEYNSKIVLSYPINSSLDGKNNILNNEQSKKLSNLSSSSVSISKVLIEFASNSVSPVEISVSGTSASTTIDNVPSGWDTLTVKLMNSSNVTLYKESKAVNIVAGSSISPTFNSFAPLNESLNIIKPNGSTEYEVGSTLEIEWSRNHTSIPVNLYLWGSTNRLETIANNSKISGGGNATYNWTIPSLSSLYTGSGKIFRVQAVSANSANASDMSSYFEINSASGGGGGGGTTYYLQEGFEGDVSRWSSNSSGSDSWAITQSEAHSGSNSAYVWPTSTDWSLIATSLNNVPQTGMISVEYYYKVDCAYSNAESTFSFYVQGNNSSTNTRIYYRTGNSTSGWQQIKSSINLNTVATPPDIFWSAQVTAGSGSCTFYLDDIKVY